MPLTYQVIKQAKRIGLHADGGGLYLSVTVGTGGALNKAFVVRYTAPDGRRREMGLGPFIDGRTSLKSVREEADRVRAMAREGVDPLEERRKVREAARAEAIKRLTFKEAAEQYIAAHGDSWSNEKHRAQWSATLEKYAFPEIGALAIGAVDVTGVTKVIEPIWKTKNETARRLRGRIESVLDWATARGYRTGENPARWRGHLDKILPKKSRAASIKHHAAMPIDELPAFIRDLKGVSGVSADALTFTILTAARTGEALGARWREVDLRERVWTVPADRMKAGREHRVPLTQAAIDAIGTPGEAAAFLFPGRAPHEPLSNMALLMQLRRLGKARYTVHGFRSTFRDWAAEKTNIQREIAEAALAHAAGDAVVAAYLRTDFFKKRRRLMELWATFCASPVRGDQNGNVVTLRASGDN